MNQGKWFGEYRCQHCGHEWREKSGAVHCRKCGHIYVDWLNWREIVARTEKAEGLGASKEDRTRRGPAGPGVAWLGGARQGQAWHGDNKSEKEMTR